MADLTTHDLSLQASWQIEAMCFALQNAAKAQDTDSLPYLVQGIAQRIIELNAAWVNALTDSGTADDLRQALFGTGGGAAS
jgi:hypothetical protein